MERTLRLVRQTAPSPEGASVLFNVGRLTWDWVIPLSGLRCSERALSLSKRLMMDVVSAARPSFSRICSGSQVRHQRQTPFSSSQEYAWSNSETNHSGSPQTCDCSASWRWRRGIGPGRNRYWSRRSSQPGKAGTRGRSPPRCTTLRPSITFATISSLARFLESLQIWLDQRDY